MIVIAILLCALSLYSQRRNRGKLVPSDFAFCVAYIGLAVGLTLFASAAVTQGVLTTLGVIGLIGVYVWHRNEIRAGRREPVWFGKHST